LGVGAKSDRDRGAGGQQPFVLWAGEESALNTGAGGAVVEEWGVALSPGAGERVRDTVDVVG